MPGLFIRYRSRWFRRLLALSCLGALAACGWPSVNRDPDVPRAAVSRPTATIAAARSPRSASDWQVIHPGLAWRTIPASPGTVRVLRVDPALVQLRVVYDPGTPKRIGDWADTLNALAVVNGAYFEASNAASALTISDGSVAGQSYTGFGGMLAVTDAGQVTLRSLVEQPYQADEPLVQALQSFPRLVEGGRELALPNDNGQQARRTVVATDQDGQVLLLVNDQPQWTLTDLGRWLADSELGIVDALNLDGGPSTGMAIRTPAVTELLDSETPLPQVVVLEAR